MKTVRCAIYTRKSSDEGLDQDFNSLDAQHEACAAYVLSQASEGWKLLPDRYDDGGISGGTLERAGLQRLLGDVEAGRIDIIVVYKVDRLTRSLLDFSKLVEAFDTAGTSFVSVTQSFNTTTSMGRLTLNMLLSFAQFEREVTAERIRDKIAASKAKGMWMGGTPPLGYSPERRSLTIVEEHAAIVRDIFARYRRLGNVRHIAEELAAEGISSPVRRTTKGQTYGGCIFTRGQLYYILRNPLYAGDIVHKGKVYPGNHSPIIDREQWNAVQQQLAANVKGVRAARERNASLLSGLLFDAEGEPLIAVHTAKGKLRYRYYVSKARHHHVDACTPALRLPAREIEQVVRRELGSLLADPLRLIERLQVMIPPDKLHVILRIAGAFRENLENRAREHITKLVRRVVIHAEHIEVTICSAWLTEVPGLTTSAPRKTAVHSIDVRLTRTGRAMRLIDDAGAAVAGDGPSDSLVNLLAAAHRWWDELSKGNLDIRTLSRRENVSASWMTRVVRLRFLAPSVVEAILTGTVRADVDGKALIATGAIDRCWGKQEISLRPSIGG